MVDYANDGPEGLKNHREAAEASKEIQKICYYVLYGLSVMCHSVWVMQPKMRQFYENSGLVVGPGYRWMDWLYSHLGWMALAMGVLLIAIPMVWRFWFRGVAKHWSLPSYFARIFFCITA